MYENASTRPCVPSRFPIVDDEYMEYVDVLLSVVEHDPSRPYVIIEAGAGYGTWTVRSIMALRQLHGAQAKYVAVAVEPGTVHMLHEHCVANGVNCTIVNAYIPRDSSAMGGIRDDGLWANRDPHTVPPRREDEIQLSKLFESIEPPVIDYLDLDIQRAELEALTEPGLLEVLNRRLQRVHIETHGTSLARSSQSL